MSSAYFLSEQATFNVSLARAVQSDCAAFHDCVKLFFVNITFRLLIVWLMLLAVPFQGFASATTMLCASSSGAQTAQLNAAVDHSHHASPPASQHHGADHDLIATTTDASGLNAHNGSLTDHHASGKCSSCAACYVGASMAPSRSSDLPMQAVDFEFLPFDSGRYPAVDLAFPERPPQSSLA